MRTISIRLDLRFLCAVLMLIILGMLALWQPWQERVNKKSIAVTGQATVERAPDQYVFTPNFSSGGATSAEAVEAVSKIGNTAVTSLRQFGIHEDQITTRVESVNASEGIEPQTYPAPRQSADKFTAYYHITCKVREKSLAQKVTDYLVERKATGGITPRAEFSLETRNQLDTEVRQKALQDARAKAEVEAKELGISLGQVVSVSEEPSSSHLMSMDSKLETSNRNASSLLLTGTERVSLSLTVTYSIK